MRMVPIARKTAHSLAVTRYSTYLITLTLTLLLTACVPIPATPQATTTVLPGPTPHPAETKASFSDLVSALAKIDESDEIQLYSQILDEFVACMQADMNSGEDVPELTDSETVAVSIFFGGMLSMGQFFALAFEQAFTEDNAAAGETENEISTYEMLEMGLAGCLEDESE